MNLIISFFLYIKDINYWVHRPNVTKIPQLNGMSILPNISKLMDHLLVTFVYLQSMGTKVKKLKTEFFYNGVYGQF
jgi:hypothetical protein